MLTNNERVVSAHLAEVVYAKTNAELIPSLKSFGFKYYKVIEESSFRVIIAQQGNTVFVAFRGTDNARNVLSSLRFIPAYTKEFGWVHRGFLNSFKKLKRKLHSELVGFFTPTATYVFLGHSLGGAVAQLATLWFSKKFTGKRLKAVTYGSPKVGMRSFRSRNKGRHTVHYRFHNDDDPVTHIPGKWFYQHSASDSIELSDIDDDYFWDSAEHSMELYRKLSTQLFVP